MMKQDLQENDIETVEFVGDYQPDYSDVIPLLRKLFKVTECEPVGHGLSCYPCPYHRMEDHDRLIVDPRSKRRKVICAKEPLLNRFIKTDENSKLYNELKDKLDAIAEKLKKVPSKYNETLYSEIIERQYVLTNLIITIQDKKTSEDKSYKYDPDDGIYKLITTNKIEKELLHLYQKLTSLKPSLSLLSLMAKNVQQLTSRPGDEDIFLPIKGNVYYLVGRVKDIEVNLITGEVRILDKDPVNRPFIKRLDYDFAMEPPKEPPPEFEVFMRYTTPKFRPNIQILLAKAFLYSGLHYIFVLYSRSHGSGKTAFFYVLDHLSGEAIEDVDPKNFQNEFFESRLVDKTILLLEEYRGRYTNINDKLKEFASDTKMLMGDKKYEKEFRAKNMLAVGITTNKMELPSDFLHDPAFMERWEITPMIRYFQDSHPPEWFEPSTDPRIREIRERLVLYIITQILPKVIRGEIKPVTYESFIILKWTSDKDIVTTKDGVEIYKIKPPDGLREFLEENAYEQTSEDNNFAEFRTLDEAFEYYIKWCDKQGQYLPLMDKEFKEQMEYGVYSSYVQKRKIEKDGKTEEVKGIYFKRANLKAFL